MAERSILRQRESSLMIDSTSVRGDQEEMNWSRRGEEREWFWETTLSFRIDGGHSESRKTRLGFLEHERKRCEVVSMHFSGFPGLLECLLRIDTECIQCKLVILSFFRRRYSLGGNSIRCGLTCNPPLMRLPTHSLHLSPLCQPWSGG